MSSGKRAVLGRGLLDLIPVGGNAAGSGSGEGPAPGLELPIAQIRPNPKQPRTQFDEGALAELVDSIRANGILQPLLVRPCATGYEIVAGERRYRAAHKAGLIRVPVVIRDLSDAETLALGLIENLLREDLMPLETSRAYKRLMDDFGWTQEEMGKRVGKSRSSVTNALRLLYLPESIQHSLERREVSEGHARALLGDAGARETPEFREKQLRVWQAILDKKLSVREVERMMKESPVAKPEETEAMRREALASASNYRAIEDRLRTALGTKVTLIGDETKGKVEIAYFSPEELDRLLEFMETSTKKAVEAEPVVTKPDDSSLLPTPKRGSDPIRGLLSTRLGPAT